MSLRCVSIIIIFVIFTVHAQNKTDERCGISVSENNTPWLVGIEFKTKHDLFEILHCTGALISRRHVISNARCFDIFFKGKVKTQVHFGSNITVTAGSCVGSPTAIRCTGDNSIKAQTDLVIVHPEYDNSQFWIFEATSYYDIALIRLRELMPYTNFIRPICLPTDIVTGSAEENADMYFIAGLSPVLPHKKLLAPVTYLDTTECQNNILAKDELCARDSEVKRLCLIDGGLVMKKRDDRYELSGLLTSRSKCDNPRIFNNLYLQLDWIQSNTTGWTPLANGCGRRKLDKIELVMNAEPAKPGDWPWHVALYLLQGSSIVYICGGTLISKTVVLTAAHCVTVQGVPLNPEVLTVVLGKYNLVGRDLESREKEVHSVIAHEDYVQTKHFQNDIALLKLKTEVIFNDYIQPACIWSSSALERLPDNRDFGTVVGWGIDQSEQLSSQLKEANMPKVPDLTCIKRNPLFYVKVLENNKKFCAGWANGTAPCNGDSGGGFLVFVPDIAKADSADAVGSWYVRGIVSLTAYDRNRGRCDPYQYVVFTDVDKYTDWVQKKMAH